MSAAEYLDAIAEMVIRCTSVNNPAERVLVERGAFEAVGHLLDPGINTDARAMRQGLNFLEIEIGCNLPRRLRNLFAAGFLGVIASARAHDRAARERAK